MTQPIPSRPPRALALDALRGIAVMGMCLSGRMPHIANMALPSWMYHAQTPPPTFHYSPNSPAGFTWVDLVFPAFLFSMGVAFPFALKSRMNKGATIIQTVFGSLLRMFALIFFAIYMSHINPWAIDAQATTQAFFNFFGQAIPQGFVFNVWHIVLFGFFLCFPVFGRFSKSWNQEVCESIRLIGILVMAGFLAVLHFKSGLAGFDIHRSNIILIVLANMAFFGSIIWLLSRRSLALRLSFLAIGFLAHLSKYNIEFLDPIMGYLKWNSPYISWFYNFGYLKYLLIIIPGTIIGDLLLGWMKRKEETSLVGWTKHLLWNQAFLMFAWVVALHITLHGRLLWGAWFISMVCIGAGWMFFSNAKSQTEKFLQKLFRWGSFWLVLGLIAEPLEGGIKKDPSNISYYFVTLGMSIFLLISLTIVIDVLKKSRWFSLLVSTGQNPMIAYLGVNTLMEPIFQIPVILKFALNEFIIGPWTYFVWGLAKTFTLAVLTSIFTKLKIFWRT